MVKYTGAPVWLSSRVSASRPVKAEGVQVRVVLGKSELLPVPAADAELVNPAVAHQLVAAADDAGVGQLGAQVIVPQIGVGVKVEDVQLRDS